MVVGMYRSFEQKVGQNPRTVEEFEAMMKQSLIEARNYVSPFVKKPVENKKVIVHNHEQNPFAPLYNPGKEVLFKTDKYHPYEPPRSLTKKTEEPKLFAAGAGGVPPEQDPSNYNDLSKLKNSVAYENNKITKKDNSYYKNVKK